jgi:hypothetical protein
MSDQSGRRRGWRPAPAPEVVWLSEPSRESLVRAGLCLLGMSDAEIDRAMREQPVKEDGSREPKRERREKGDKK